MSAELEGRAYVRHRRPDRRRRPWAARCRPVPRPSRRRAAPPAATRRRSPRRAARDRQGGRGHDCDDAVAPDESPAHADRRHDARRSAVTSRSRVRERSPDVVERRAACRPRAHRPLRMRRGCPRPASASARRSPRYLVVGRVRRASRAAAARPRRCRLFTAASRLPSISVICGSFRPPTVWRSTTVRWSSVRRSARRGPVSVVRALERGALDVGQTTDGRAWWSWCGCTASAGLRPRRRRSSRSRRSRDHQEPRPERGFVAAEMVEAAQHSDEDLRREIFRVHRTLTPEVAERRARVAR